MNEKQMTPLEAFEDFLKWVHSSGRWGELTNAEKNRIITARRDSQLLRGERHRLGADRIRKVLGNFAPGRYTFTETVTLNET